MGKVSKVLSIPCTEKNFFRWWFELLKPVHHLTDRESDVIAVFVKKRFELSQSITDPKLLDEILMQEKYKREVREEAGVSAAFFQVIMGKLRQNNVIKDGKINPKYLPPLKDGNITCLTFVLKMNEAKGSNT
jgi:hypothetical protein